MLEKDRLHSYLYGPRAPPMERWFSTTTGYSSDQDARRQGGGVGKTGTIRGHHNTPPYATQHSGGPCSLSLAGKDKPAFWVYIGGMTHRGASHRRASLTGVHLIGVHLIGVHLI